MELSEIKDFCIKELKGIETRNSILDIFYILLKDKGQSYIALRTAWIKTRSRQLDLFKEVKNGKYEVNLLSMQKAFKRKP